MTSLLEFADNISVINIFDGDYREFNAVAPLIVILTLFVGNLINQVSSFFLL